MPVGVAVRIPQGRIRFGRVDGFDAARLEAAFEDGVVNILQSGCVEVGEVGWHICVGQESRDAQVLAGDGG